MRLLGCLLAIGIAWADTAQARVIHSENSLYQNILVTQDRQRRCLQFTVRSDQRNQSCQYLRHPERLVFDYTQMMLAALLLNDPDDPEQAPERILMVGLGGGSQPTLLAELYPDAVIDVVELDPAVVRVARDYFDFEETQRVRVHERDARVFGKRAALRDAQYDLILLDAFNGDYIPEHLMTREYLEEVQALMAPDATVVANTFSISRLYDHESVTYRDVFGPFFNLKIPGSANRIIIASDRELPSRDVLEQRAEHWAPRLERYDVPIDDYPARMTTAADWDTGVRPLTDQYSPANLLQGSE